MSAGTLIPGRPDLEVTASRWWTAATPAGGLIGAVLVTNMLMGTVKAFIGSGEGEDQDSDRVLIAEWGAKLDPGLGKVMFPAYAGERWADEGDTQPLLRVE